MKQSFEMIRYYRHVVNDSHGIKIYFHFQRQARIIIYTQSSYYFCICERKFLSNSAIYNIENN